MEWNLTDNPEDPKEFFVYVLPRNREAYHLQYALVRTALSRGTFAAECSAWAVAGNEPVGVALMVGKPATLVVGVMEQWRRRGIGAALVRAVCDKVRRAGAKALAVRSVSSANTAAVRLLESVGFVGAATGGLRMRRALGGTLPPYTVASNHVLRTLREGEAAAYVALINACFPESRAWTEEDFHREFSPAHSLAYERIFVVVREGELAGTASAWEADWGEGPAGLLHWVGVRSVHRGQGLGEVLSARVLAELATRGYREAWLNTSRDREAAGRLYRRLGFVEHRELYDYRLAL